LKNGFAAAQKSFSLPLGLHIIVIDFGMLISITERRKTFDSLLANHFSAVMQSSRNMFDIRTTDFILKPDRDGLPFFDPPFPRPIVVFNFFIKK